MRIPLDLARTLAVVVAEGTFDAAARTLAITPSAVSQRVKALEQQLGRVLLARSKPVRPTEAGAAIVRLARQLDLLEHEALAGFGLDAAPEHPISIPLAVNADSLGTWILPPLADVAARHPVVFDLYRDDQDFTTELLESGTVMAAITSQSTPVAGCVVRPLGAMRYRAVATPAFATRWFPDGVTPEALGRAPVVDFDRRDNLQAAYARAVGADPADAPRHYVPASNDFAVAVKLGLGWGMLPSFQSVDELASGALVPLGGPPFDVPLYWQQWNLRSPLLDGIADAVVAAARSTLDALG
ncbi:LysR family transcriptional regulator ArgP [Agromyces aerolatus]|uniref:LysR family transcriptional regulator ArgP n=1 Tax=Agromyces sp. LY-1074 TaxID=3074080 RepID=UPI00285543F1|nr:MULTISPECIES: LysR family transcriptional regulator ArgP [unclassified Agromyces]MDR5701246.1 LysR family transcriptional regulator ArgP [Agromyces sp. LY-1074]MDR5706878.1 LysR family transcriptional regulator ArgP [Agromyces sp. LY-1358]